MCVCLQLDSHCHIISRFQPIPVVCWSSDGGSHEPACQHVRVVRGPKVKVSQVGSWDTPSVRCEQVWPADTCKQALDRLVSRRWDRVRSKQIRPTSHCRCGQTMGCGQMPAQNGLPLWAAGGLWADSWTNAVCQATAVGSGVGHCCKQIKAFFLVGR